MFGGSLGLFQHTYCTAQAAQKPLKKLYEPVPVFSVEMKPE